MLYEGIELSKLPRYGEVVVDGHRFINRVPITIVPKKPADNKIYGHSFERKNQKWQRQDYPKDFQSYSAEDKKAWYEREWDRRWNGFWFYNDGEPTYITGAHYFYINWCQIDIGYPDYRDRDRRFYYFWEECSKDPNSYGMIFMKHRREGASWKSASLQLYYTTGEQNAHGGMISKTGGDASKLFQKAVYIWRRLPDFFMPISDGTDNPKTAINFQRPSKRRTAKNQIVDNGKALDSSVSWMTTTENAYDGQKLRFFNSDECGKMIEISAENNWYIVKPAMSMGRRIYGKALFTSTVNDMDKGGKAFKSLWEDSDFFNRDANDQTKSGLYRYMTTAFDGYEGFIDEYGRSVIEDPEKPVMGIDGVLVKSGSKTFLNNRRKTLAGDTNKLAEEKRMHPFDEEEALRAPAKDCRFDSERIYQQIEWLDVYEDTYVTRGNFVWAHERGGKVEFMPTDSGRWLVAWLPEGDQRCKKDNNGYPSNMGGIVSGCDPYDHRHVSDGRGSKAASYVFRMMIPNEEDTNMFVCQYLYRQPSPEMFYEDILMQSIFYGCQVLVETQKIGILNWFEREGFGKYIMDRPESTQTSWSRANQKSKGVPSSPYIIDSITGATEHYVLTNCGLQSEEGKVGNVLFRDLLEDWLKFDPDNTKDYDCTMAAGYALLATKKAVRVKKEIKSPAIVRKFDNRGVISKMIN